MSARNAPPPALQPYIRLPPESSLILLTSTLGTSTTWLTSRFVSSVLATSAADDRTHAVVLVSWLRDENFWASEVRRASGQDIAKLQSAGHFAFVDGLDSLAASTTRPPSNPDTPTPLDQVEAGITTAISPLSPQSKTITLILDAPDTLLATSHATPSTLHTLLLRLRSKVHTTIHTLSADLPFLSAATTPHLQGFDHPTPLETSTAAFLAQQAHLARFVMGVRELETGAARDVSGVLRVTRGGDAGGFDLGGDGEGAEEVREMEALFLVGRDGGVKVFERGSAG